MRHEILNEEGKQEVYDDIVHFLDQECEAAEPILAGK